MITTSWNEVEYTAADGKVYKKYVASNIDELYAEGERIAAENAANPQNDAAKTLAGLTTSQAIQLRLDNYLTLLRDARNQLLLESDWTRIDDCGISTSKKAEWATYRQELRDITKTVTPVFLTRGIIDESKFSWPTKPS